MRTFGSLKRRNNIGFGLLGVSISKAVPREHGELDDGEERDERQQVPNVDVTRKQPVLEEHGGRDQARLPGNAGRTAAVFEKAFVDQPAEQWDPHCFPSSVKMSSTVQRKMRAKVSASSRLGS